MSCLLATRSDIALPTTDRFQGQSAWRAKCPNIPHGWLAEEATVFAIELAGALVSDLECRTGGVHTIHKHAFQRCNRSKTCPLGPPEDSVDDLALNQSTEKGNVLRGVQQVQEPTACVE